MNGSKTIGGQMKSLFFQNFFDCCCVCFPIVTVLLNISPPPSSFWRNSAALARGEGDRVVMAGETARADDSNRQTLRHLHFFFFLRCVFVCAVCIQLLYSFRLLTDKIPSTIIRMILPECRATHYPVKKL